MTLTRKVSFKSTLRCERVIIPKLYRWQHKLETSQILKVTINITGLWSNKESYLTRMHKDGHIGIPRTVQARLKREEQSLEGCDMDITIEPA